MDKTKRIKQLTKLLNEYRDAYYNRGESIISDYDYDNLFKQELFFQIHQLKQ